MNSDAPHNRTRDNERKAWRDEFQRLAKLGRDLKHASDRRAKLGATGENITAADEKLATATAVEAVLCEFGLSAGVGETRKPSHRFKV